ncbi:MAG: NADH-quinone oxidoreductase subunit M [Luteolibacter sp.]|jgi:NADH-quinone oxidoreductase subunit M|nr:NADH-quinone oxidoreductase subunit M [Luteolibacter sp.]
MHLLYTILFPLLGAVWLGVRPGMSRKGAGTFALACSLLALALACGSHGAQWLLPWMPDAGMNLSFRVNGISWLFLVLTGLVVSFAIAASPRNERAGRGYYALILVMQSALFGVFTARHFIPWFLCWEMTLIPSYLLIRLWGGGGAPRAALRFFIMTLGGSAFLLVGFLALQLSAGTMDFSELAKLAANQQLTVALARTFVASGLSGHTLLTVVALAVFLGFAVKLPVVPFHAWLPAAYAEAPTPVTMLLTGLLSKMAVYGLLVIFLPVFPEVLPSLAPLLSWLAAATVLLGALAALAQTDLKRLLAYSSVNHLGYCALAIAAAASMQGDRNALAAALSGTVLQAFNHGIIASTLFFGIGIMEQRGGGLRGLNDFGGLRAQTPVFCGLFGLAVFASLGLPGLSGFVGEFLIFNGVFALTPGVAVLSVLGLLFTAVFLLRMMRKVFHGPFKPALAKWPDLSNGERLLFGLATALIVIPGLFPQALLRFANPGIVELLDLLRPIP